MISNGREYQLCLQGEVDPSAFGIFDMSGLWFVQGNLVRDLAALNKMELLPWDVWGCMGGDDNFTDEERDLMDRTAMVTLAGDAAFS